ncbi:MAG: EcsC family protein, partial [Burkholderiales bacterium]
MPISKAEIAELKRAKLLLENPSLAARLSSMLGSPLERGMAMLPARFQSTVQKASEAAMMKALDVAVTSIGSETSRN